MFTVYSIVEDGSEADVLECKTLAEAAEHLEMLVTDAAIFIEGPDEGQDEPEEYSPTAPPCYGIKFNLREAWEVMEAMKAARCKVG